MSRLVRRAAVTLLTLLVLLPSSALAAEATLAELEREVMCPVCGTLLELAEAPQAQRQKEFIKGLIAEGADKEQIKDALVAEFGPAVLAEPEGEGFNLSAYVVPVVGFAVAAIALAVGVVGWRRAGGGRGPGGGNGTGPSGPSGAERERLDADLARYDL